MMIDSYTDVVTMQAKNGKRLFLTEKDGKITWTYYRKYAMQFNPELGAYEIIKAVKNLSKKDRQNLKITRLAQSVFKEVDLIQTTLRDFIQYEIKQGNQWIGKFNYLIEGF